MLTRLEVDGFKNLIGFAVDFGPYTCIAGQNGTGKSNIFDAIHFLSLLADHSRLAELVPVTTVDVERDDVRELLTLSVIEAGGQQFAANTISDGTLRFLAFSVLAEDPEAKGLICIEEPENGIHPERLPAMAELIRDLAVDVDNPIDSGNIMRQVILATHSPYFLPLQSSADVLLAQEAMMRYGESSVRGLRCYPLEGSWRAEAEGGGPALGLSMMQDYLQPPEGVQLRLPFGSA